MKAMILIGPSKKVAKNVLPELTRSIMQVINSSAGDDVKKTAIVALAAPFKVESVNIANNHFQGETKK